MSSKNLLNNILGALVLEQRQLLFRLAWPALNDSSLVNKEGITSRPVIRLHLQDLLLLLAAYIMLSLFCSGNFIFVLALEEDIYKNCENGTFFFLQMNTMILDFIWLNEQAYAH